MLAVAVGVAVPPCAVGAYRFHGVEAFTFAANAWEAVALRGGVAAHPATIVCTVRCTNGRDMNVQGLQHLSLLDVKTRCIPSQCISVALQAETHLLCSFHTHRKSSAAYRPRKAFPQASVRRCNPSQNRTTHETCGRAREMHSRQSTPLQ